MKKAIIYLLVSLLAFIFVLSAYMIISQLEEEQQAKDFYAACSNQTIGVTKPEGTPLSAEKDDSETSTSNSEVLHTPHIPLVDIALLQKEYPDIVGWLFCEGTPINHPIVQGKDNQYYLRRLPDKSHNTAGSLFADYRCSAIGQDDNYIIYGHNMKNGSMFHCLANYNEQSYYDQHPTMFFLTSDQVYRIELLAGFVTKNTGDIYNTAFTEDQWKCLKSTMIESSTFLSQGTVLPSDKLITLSTCSYEFNNARYVVVGKLQPLSQSPE